METASIGPGPDGKVNQVRVAHNARAMRKPGEAGGVVLAADWLAHDATWQVVTHAKPGYFQHTLKRVHTPPMLFEPDVTDTNNSIQFAMVLARLRDSRLVIPKAHVQLNPAASL